MSLRFLVILVRGVCGARLGVGEWSVLRFRVLPDDMDFNLHMNNGRYLTLMDLGRIDVLVRGGMLGTAVWRRWQPLLGGATIRFRRSLPPFARFVLRTRLVAFDDRWFVFEQRFERNGELCALALARGLFRGRTGTVAPAEVLRAGGVELAALAAPPHVRAWIDADDATWAAATADRA